MSKKILAIDVRDNLLSAVLFSYGFKDMQIVDSLYLNLAGAINSDGLLQNLKDAIVNISEKMGDTYDKCIVTIPANYFFFRTIMLPFKSRKDISQILPFEIEQLIPCHIDEISCDFNLFGKKLKDPAESNRASVASIQKSQLNFYKSAFEECGIHPDVVTVGSGYSSALVYAGQNNNPGVSIFIHMESTFAGLYVIKSGEIVFLRACLTDYADPVHSIKKSIVQTFLSYNELSKTDTKINEVVISGSNSGHGYCPAPGSDSAPDSGSAPGSAPGSGSFPSFPSFDSFMNELRAVLEKEFDIHIRVYNILKGSTKINFEPEACPDHNLELLSNAIAMCINETRGSNCFNFSQKTSNLELFFNENKSGIITSTILIIMLFISLAIDPAIKINAMEKRVSFLDTKIMDVFKSSFPDVKTIVDPVQQMASKIAALKKREKVDLFEEHPLAVDLLQSISKSLPADLDINFSRIVVTDTNIIISGTTDRFNTVDDMKSDLTKVKIFKSVEINSASMDKSRNRVKFNLKILL